MCHCITRGLESPGLQGCLYLVDEILSAYHSLEKPFIETVIFVLRRIICQLCSLSSSKSEETLVYEVLGSDERAMVYDYRVDALEMRF